jgi:hypothetical protein
MKILPVAILFITTLIPMSLIADDVNQTKAENELKVEIKKQEKNVQTLDSKIIIGQIQMIKITPPKVILEARIDTGATTTSIDARDITEFERDGKKWVKYTVIHGKKKHELESPIDKTVLIKRHGKEAQERYVIKMRVSAGTITQLIDVTLADRSEYKFPILIGRNFLKDYFIVDVSRSNILKTK